MALSSYKIIKTGVDCLNQCELPQKVTRLLGIPEVSAAGFCNSKGELPDDHWTVTCLLEMQTGKSSFVCFFKVNIVDFKDDLQKTLFSQSADESKLKNSFLL